MSDDSRPIEILIVDDEPSVRLLLKRWIERSFAANLREAADGLQALEEVSGGDVEMMIVDINMPVLNGIEMLRALQADPSRKRMEILVASQVANEEKVRQAIALGVSDYLLKPLQYDWVAQRIGRAAERIYERRRNTCLPAASSRTRVLVADADPNYCAFAESTLSGDFSIETCRTVAATIVKAMRFRPDVLLLDSRLPGLDRQLLSTALSRLAGGDAPRVYELVPDASSEAPDGANGVIEHTFVPEALRSQLIALLRGGVAPERGALAWAASLEAEVRTALFQALGMLTGVEPEAVDEPPEGAERGVYCWIGAVAGDGELVLRLGIQCGRDLPRKLKAAMLEEEAAEDDGSALCLDAIREILNILAGRLKSSCAERKLDISIGQPQGGFEPPIRKSPFERDACYRWADCEPFLLRLEATPLREPCGATKSDRGQ